MAKLLEYLNIKKEKISQNDIRRLDLLIESYPYFNTLYIIKLIVLFKFNQDDFKKEFKKAHIRIQDIKRFYEIISPLRYEYEFKALHKFVVKSNLLDSSDAEKATKKEVNTQSTKKPTIRNEKKEIVAEKSDIIEKNVAKDIHPKTEISEVDNSAKKSTKNTKSEEVAEGKQNHLLTEFDENSIKEIVNKQVEVLKKKKQNKKEELPSEEEKIVSENEMNEEDMISSILEQVDKIKKSKVQLKNNKKVDSDKEKEDKKESIEVPEKKEKSEIIKKKKEKPIESLDEFLQKRKLNEGEIEKTEDGKIRYRTKYKISEDGKKNPKKAMEFLREMADEHRKDYDEYKEKGFTKKLEKEKESLLNFSRKFRFEVVKFTHKTLKQTLPAFLDREITEIKTITVEPSTSQKIKIETPQKSFVEKPKKEEIKQVENKKGKETQTDKVETDRADKKDAPLSVADKILLKVAKRKQGKDVKNKQADPIDRFIKEEPRLDRNKPIKEEDVSVPSVKEDESIVTPTLAQVYLNQKLYEKALEAYEKLSLKYPEKSTYFAAQIEKIKKLINEQK